MVGTMRAGLVTGHRRFELVEMPEPVASEGLAVVEIARCGICGTDLHGFLGHDPYNPAICGHEFSGRVSAVGAGVRNVSEGDLVVGAIAPPCGRCSECLAGRTTLCITAFLGMVGRDARAPKHGGFAPRLAIAADRLVPVREPLSDSDAAVVEPATVALHAVYRTPPGLSDVVVIQGCGPIGLLVLQMAKVAGLGRLVVVEPNAGRRALALQLGADAAVSPAEANDEVRGGADLVFECAGIPPTVQQAVDLVRRGGRVNLVGYASGKATIDPGMWLRKEVVVTASLGYLHHEFADVISLISSKRVDVTSLCDKTVSLAQLPEAIEELADDPASAIKVLVDPAS
jgi:(R,R)-butanediol dehydrogenase / meso-butanediol dehydrogenase / diacetyl reductase